MTGLRRRRVLEIFAGHMVAAAALSPALARAGPTAADPLIHRWQGVAMGARASIYLADEKPERAQSAISACLKEIDRLESIYSLFRPDSALSTLNRDGRLAHPPVELVAALALARRLSVLSGGAFDVSIQPAWRATADGLPRAQRREILRSRVDYRAIAFGADEVRLELPRMALTLNGLAQGDLCDRVAAILADYGFAEALVNLGEYRAVGPSPEGGPWLIGLEDGSGNRAPMRLPLVRGAVATSALYGVDLPGGAAHIFDALGRSAGSSAAGGALTSVTVRARRAIVADGLSTAILAAGARWAAPLTSAFAGASALLFGRDEGSVLVGDPIDGAM